MTGTATSGHGKSSAGQAGPQGVPKRRRASDLPAAMAVTLLGALLPGAGYLWTRRHVLGLLVLLPTVALTAAAGWYVGRDFATATDLAFDPSRLRYAVGVMAVALTLWAVVVVTTYRMVRPPHLTRLQTTLGGSFVLVLCLSLAAPVVVGARYALTQADLVETVFEDNRSATAPQEVIEEDPWAERPRVNVLLLGGDGNVQRDGVRTDSIILASVDTRTGHTVLFSLPRNLIGAQFPPGSALHDLYPDGYTGEGDPATSMLNAVYGQVPARHPKVLGESDNEGADALKQAVAGSLGVDVDYYVLVNLLGFRDLVDAMGGVTVNVSKPVPIGGNIDLGIPPEDYLEPGPDQRLDGFEALWYSRGRYGSDDYERMERQRCMVRAIIEEAQPWTLLRRFEDLAATGKEIVRTDIPAGLMPAFVDLALRVKDAPVTSVVFRRSAAFSPGDPDFEWMRAVVRKALADSADRSDGRPQPSVSAPSSAPPPSSDGPRADAADPGPALDAADACAFRP